MATFNIGIEQYDAELLAIEAIDEKLTTLSGTMAEWQTKGKVAARETSLADYVKNDGGASVKAFWKNLNATKNYGDFADVLQSYHEDVQQFGNELLTEWLKAHAPSDTETKALIEQRDAHVTMATSIRNILAQMDSTLVFADIPSAPKGKPGRKSSGSKNVRFYRVIDGERDYPSDHQQSMSSRAFYWWKVDVDTLRKALADGNGGKPVDETKPYETTVSITSKGVTRTVTFGWEVNDPTDTDTDESDTADDDGTDDNDSDKKEGEDS